MDECHCDQLAEQLAEAREYIEDLRAALCMAEDDLALRSEELEDEQAAHHETVLDANYVQDVLDEIRTLCNVPWDVTNSALPDYLSARIVDFTPRKQEDEETNSLTLTYNNSDTFVCSCCGAIVHPSCCCASCGTHVV